MGTFKRDWRAALVPVFLAAQFLTMRGLAGVEHPPAPPPLARFPVQVGGWTVLREDPVAADMASELGADRLLSRTYVRTPANSLASLFVAWFRTQRGGVRQPHSPKVCLPASGWTPELTDEVPLDTAAGAIAVNRYVAVNRMQRAVVLYWYQTPRRAIASEWASKFWLVADALRDRRTDTALVRVITWPGEGGEAAATATAKEFARDLYPLLREYLFAPAQ
ncbi:MAG: exosortase C-terminal domain/associated protein EpsI [Bryobacteraceae bacterium]|jgi:EpsI family protein